jgi:DNA-damage-inducible protein J
MAGTTNINVRVDKELKRKAEAIFNELGLNMSTAMNIFLRYSVRYGGIPFDLRLDTPNEKTRAAIDDVNNNRNMSKTFDSVKGLMDDLNLKPDTPADSKRTLKLL